MASNQTEHYGLNQWAGEDSFLRSEFNEDNRRIDAALARCDVVFGTYDGTYDTYTSPSQEITLGFRPRAVLVLPKSASGSDSSYSSSAALAIDGSDAHYLSITDTGFLVSGQTNLVDKNQQGYIGRSPYRYIAWR